MPSTSTFRIPQAEVTGTYGATDGMVANLVEQLGAPAVVELTQLVALENMRSRFNCAAGLQSQGHSDVCELRLARPSDAVPSQP
jgi:hypothetical protein